MGKDLRLARWEIGARYISHILLARPDPLGVVVEVVKHKPDTELIEVIDLYVHPKRRGRGWAAILMQAATNFADRRGAAMALRAWPEGDYGPRRLRLPYEGLKKFYSQHGFRTVPIRDPSKLSYRIPLDSVMYRKART